MYHGGNDADSGGPRWFTSSRSHAEGYVRKSGGDLWYVDVPRSDPMFDADYADQTVDQGVTVQGEFDPAPYGAPRRLVVGGTDSRELDVDTDGSSPQTSPSPVQEDTGSEENVPADLAPGRQELDGGTTGPLPTVPQPGDPWVPKPGTDYSDPARPVPNAAPEHLGKTLREVEAEVGRPAMGRLMTELGYNHGAHALASANSELTRESASISDVDLQVEVKGRTSRAGFPSPPDGVPTTPEGRYVDYGDLDYGELVSYSLRREVTSPEKVVRAREAAARNPDTPRYALEEAGGEVSLTPDQAAAVQAEVEAMADLLGGVTVVEGVEALPESVRDLTRDRLAEGWAVPGVYTPEGSYVLVDQVARAAAYRGERPEVTARRVVLHELVAHEGLRAALGDRFVPTMRAIYERVGLKRIRESGVLDRYRLQVGFEGGEIGDAQKVELAEEYLGYLAGKSKSVDPSLWERVRAAVQRAFGRFGDRLTDGDLQELLWATNRYLRAVNAGGPARTTSHYTRVRAPHVRAHGQADPRAAAEDIVGVAEMDRAVASRWNRAFDQARDLGLVEEADAIKWRVVLQGEGEGLSDAERAALVLEAGRLRALRDEKLAEVERLVNEGAPGVPVAQADLHAVTTKLVQVAEAHRQASLQGADPLGWGNVDLASSAHTEETVVREAVAMKGAPLTAEERAEIVSKAEALREADAEVERLEAQARSARAESARAEAEARVERARRDREALEARAEGSEEGRAEYERKMAALAEEREAIRADLRRLGMRVNDVTGVTVEGAYHVGRMALNVAKSGYYTLDEVVREVQRQLPDKSANEVLLALAERKRDENRTDKELLEARVKQRRAQRAVREAQRALVPQTWWDRTVEYLNIPRTLMATLDMSGTLRQGAILAFSRPAAATRAFGRATQAFFSSNTAEEIDYLMRTDPRQFKREAAGLFLAPLGSGTSLLEREETFISRVVQRLGWLGAPIRASERHMLTFLNLVRAAAFDNFADNNPDATPDQLRAYAEWVNVASGRGDLGDFNQAGTKLATVFFSPRFAVSRFQAPYHVLKQSKNLAKSLRSGDAGERAVAVQVIKDFSGWFLVVSGTLALAALAGDDEDERVVGLTPRDSDFGKLVAGGLRFDPWSGLAQPARLLGRTALVFTDRTGATEKPRWDREQDPYELAARFVKYKASPQVSLGLWALTGKDALGQERSLGETAAKSLLPLGLTETYDTGATYEGTEKEVPYATAVFVGNFFGVGVSAYGDALEDSHVQPLLERAGYAPRHGRADKERFKAALGEMILRERGALMEMDDATLDRTLRIMADRARRRAGPPTESDETESDE